MEYRVTRSDELSHHGILGQKWGVRRYQNSDGTLTDEGRKRYGKKLADDIVKIDKKYGNSKKYGSGYLHYKTFERAYDDPLIKDFDKQSSRKELDTARENKQKRASELSDEVNQKLIKKYGNPLDLPDDQMISYVTDGMKMMQDLSAKDKKLSVLHQKYIDASKKYEKEAAEYVEKSLGEFGNRPVSGITYNIKTGDVRQPTVNERLVIEMLRRAGGNI